MKLPEEIQDMVDDRGYSMDEIREAIVRDCAKVVFDPERDDVEVSPVSHGAYLAILARYGLEEQP